MNMELENVERELAESTLRKNMDREERIASALERIASALEKMQPIVEKLAIAWAKMGRDSRQACQSSGEQEPESL